MLKNYLTIAARNLQRRPVYSIINIAGLAVGMACCILIMLFIQDELSYDRFHTNADRIYRVAVEQSFGNKVFTRPMAPASLAPALKETLPEVIKAVRIRTWLFGRVLVTHQNKRFYEDKGFGVDESFFEVFTFPFLKGDPKTALRESNAVVITEKMAQKYFGDEDPMGKTLRIADHWNFKVAGVLKSVPHNSHLTFDFLAPFRLNLEGESPEPEHQAPVYTYLLLSPSHSASELERKFPAFLKTYAGVLWFGKINPNAVFRPYLQPLTDIHLHSHLDRELEPNRNISDLYLFSVIALLILLIACINYMNLATARSATRAREVGLRKVVGAYRTQLIRQFLGESLLLSFISLLLAVTLAELFLPVFNAFMGTELRMDYSGNGTLWLGLVALSLLVGVVSGSYPAFFLSAFQPVEVLKGTLSTGVRSIRFRKGLVVFQFVISIGLIILTGTVYTQLRYMKTRTWGFNQEQALIVPSQYLDYEKLPALKNRLLQNPHVLGVTAAGHVPADRFISQNFIMQRRFYPEGAQTSEHLDGHMLHVDYDFIDVLGVELVEGRKFSREFATDEKEALILNEEAVRNLGWKSPIGKKIKFNFFHDWNCTVIGVIEDFHLQPLYHKVEPLALLLHPRKFPAQTVNFVFVKIRPDDILGTLAFIKETWREFVPPYALFEYSFLDESIDRLYKSETRLTQTFGVFSLLAIFVACLGLFGLASFTAERRTREIGVRKVLGASVADIVKLLSKDFLKLVVAANLIAWPVAYFIAEKWLQNFAYRMNMGIGIFALAGGLALGIALLTVSAQAVQAALANPVDALRNE